MLQAQPVYCRLPRLLKHVAEFQHHVDKKKEKSVLVQLHKICFSQQRAGTRTSTHSGLLAVSSSCYAGTEMTARSTSTL
jgi:hypothetical protein